MNRSNIFMWTYIGFIGICSILRMITDYTIWSSIVLGITVSSALFAVEDLFTSISCVFEKRADASRPFVDKRMEVYAASLGILSSAVTEEQNEPQKGTGNTNKIHNETIEESLKDVFQEALNINEFTKEIEKDKKASKNFRCIAVVCAYLGFSCLLLAMLTSSFFKVSVVAQEILTVVSFMIILANKQVGELTEKIINAMINKQEVILKRQEQKCSSLREKIEKTQCSESDTDSTEQACSDEQIAAETPPEETASEELTYAN